MIQGNILANKILVVEKKVEEKRTSSGIIIPGIGKEPQISGSVIQVGAGLPTVPMVVSVGQTVLYYPNAAQRFKIDDEDVALLDVRDVLFFF